MIGGRVQRDTIWRLAAVALLLTLTVALLTYRAFQQPAVRLNVGTGAYQGNPHCLLVADVLAEGVAPYVDNRLQINATQDCTLCAESWTVGGSKTVRLRVFVRPCPPMGVSRGIRPWVNFASALQSGQPGP